MAGGRLRGAILIAGPTASGKSALAVEVARRTGGAIVNTDSMQGYSVLDVLTARPGASELAAAPHFLYGHVHPSRAYSTGAWLRDVAELVRTGAIEGRRAIFVGGTGLYFRALTQGLSEMPAVPQPTRERWRYELHQQGPDRLHRILAREDPAAARLIERMDGQRIVRALEVLEASGRSILEWRRERSRPLLDTASAALFVVTPDRADLAARIGSRFDAMLDQGAVEEVKTLLALGLDPGLPAMKAIGVRELQAAITGETSFAEAIERAKAATRQYAKRQGTWFRTQFGPEWVRIDAAAADVAARLAG